MPKKQSTYAPRISCQHHTVKLDKTIKVYSYDPREGDTLTVPQGAVVSKHFKPECKNAKTDRLAQIKNPAQYAESKYELILLCELQVAEGNFSSLKEAEKAIIADKGESIESPDDLDKQIQQERVAEVMKSHSKAEMKELLDEASIGYFNGAKDEQLAAKLLANDLI